MMTFQEIGDGTEDGTEYQRWKKTEAKMRAVFWDGKVLPYCFYPKKVIKNAISIIMISWLKWFHDKMFYQFQVTEEYLSFKI